MSHPGVCRLVSCFRYTNSVYLVLEYASRGDLHSYILGHARERNDVGSLGGLKFIHMRFIIAEILATLAYIHSQGFVFGDLKPENVLITAVGHVKLADFGGCRCMFDRSGNSCGSIGVRGLTTSYKMLTQLRDGGWRAVYPDGSSHKESDNLPGVVIDADIPCVSNTEAAMISAELDAILKPQHAEGTLAYLPPEILGSMETAIIDTLCDSWAVGCVAYFCAVGKPLFYGSSVEDILFQQRKLKLVGSSSGNASDNSRAHIRFGCPDGDEVDFTKELFPCDFHSSEQSLSCSISQCMMEFVVSLLSPLRSARISVEKAAQHSFIRHGHMKFPSPGEASSPAVDGVAVLDAMKLHYSTPAVKLPVVECASEVKGCYLSV